MRNKLQFVVFFLPFFLMAGGFDEVAAAFRRGEYTNEMTEINYLFREWGTKGLFLDYQKMVRDHIPIRLAKRQKTPWKALLQLEAKRNDLLKEAVRTHPGEEIARIAHEIVRLSDLSREHSDALNFMALLEAGGIDSQGDPHLRTLERILQEHNLKAVLIESLLVKAKISPGTAKLYTLLIALDKDQTIEQYCNRYGEVPSLAFCRPALVVQEAQYRVAFEEQNLTNLLTGLRAPENLAEEKVKQVLRSFQHLKEKVLATKS